MNEDELLELLCKVWHREVSADDAFDEINSNMTFDTEL
jgi:hypothetical protein